MIRFLAVTAVIPWILLPASYSDGSTGGPTTLSVTSRKS